MLRKRARERRRLEEIREAGPEQQNVSNGSQFMKKMVELQATMEESFTDDQKLAFEFGSAYLKVYQELESELRDTAGQSMNDQPEKAEDSDRTLNASDFEVKDISIKGHSRSP